jgi:hypothetical protein
MEEAHTPGRVLCVDPWQAYFDTEKNSAETYREMNAAAVGDKIFRLFEHNIRTSGIAHCVEVRRGTSRDVLPQLPAASFDIVYIDGSHRFEDVLHDIREARRLVRDGGIICGDDLELEASSLDQSELSKAVADDREFVYSTVGHVYYHPGVTQAVAEEFSSLGVWNGFWAVCRCGTEWTSPILDLRSACIPAHIQPCPRGVRLVESNETYNFVETDDSVVAIAKAIGPADLFREHLGDRELSPVLLKGSSREEVRRKVEEQGLSRPNGSEPDVAPLLHGSVLGKAVETLGAPALQLPDTQRAAIWLSYEKHVGRPRSDRPLPDFLGNGPAKTGTHWIAYHLGRHSAIHIPPQKELNYFNHQWRFENVHWYQQKFVNPGDSLRGEFCPGYALLPSFAIRTIQQMMPELKLIFLFRRLPERAWSQARHCWRYREMTYRNRTRLLSEASPAELVADFLADHSMLSSDYEGILRRWMEFFPVQQFHVRYFEDAIAHPEEYLRDLLQFLGVDAGLPPGDSIPINQGTEADLPPWAARFLENLFATRQIQVEAFLGRTFGLEPVWRTGERTIQDPVWVEDRMDGWRVRLRDGIFEATQLKGGAQIRSPFLGIIRRRIDEQNGVISPIAALTEEDQVLASIPGDDRDVTEAEPMDHSRSLVTTTEDQSSGMRESLRIRDVQAKIRTDSREPVHLVGDHRGFNLLRQGGKVYGLRQTLGEIDWSQGPEALHERYGPRDLVVGESAGEVRAWVDVVEAAAALEADLREKQEALAARAIANQQRLDRLEFGPTGDPETLQLIGDHRGFNLLRQGGKVYGLRQTLGEIDWSQGPKALHERYGPRDLVVGESAGEVRARVDVVEAAAALEADLREKQEALAARAIANQQRLDRLEFGPTGDPETLRLIGDYRGFNLLRQGGKVYGLRQTLGEIDWSLGPEALLAQYEPGDFLVGDSTGELRARLDVDQLCTEMHQRQQEQLEEVRALRVQILGEHESHQAEALENHKEWTSKLNALSTEMGQTKSFLLAALQQIDALLEGHSRILGHMTRSWIFRVFLFISGRR